MKTISLYELYGLAKEHKAPKKIKYDGVIYTGDKRGWYHGISKLGFSEELHKRINPYNLNDKIEIIEEDKKIEKLNLDKDELLKNVIITAQDYVIEDKINELIDKVNSLEKED